MDGSVLANRYRIEARIGAGGMAEVYRGFDPVLNRTVAIKILNPQFARDASFVERFRREAQAAARLNHPNIVGVYDTGADGETQFIVMEFIEGRTLADFLSGGPATHARAGGRDRPEDLRRAGRGARAGRDPPRHQAGQRHGDARRHREGHGLRHRAHHGGPRDRAADVGGAGHRLLSLARAGAGRARSTRARTSTRWARCCTRCWPAGRRSPASPPSPSPTNR